MFTLLLLLCATGSDVSHVTGSDAITGSDVNHMTGSDTNSGSDVSHVTGSDVIAALFFTSVVVQNVPLHGKLEDTKGIIRSRKSNDKQHNDQKIPR
jgi:hypothetical protein